jgi:Cof subfamily protein (haloacid dehalogenase superfamily)
MARAYDALVLDIDGTLLDEREQVHPRTQRALDRARADGVIVMLATGRSQWSTREVMDQVAIDAPCLVLNGAAVYSKQEDRLIEHYALAEDFVNELLGFAERKRVMPVLSCVAGQFARVPNADEPNLLPAFRALSIVAFDDLPRRDVIRVTFLSTRHQDSAALHDEVLRAVPWRSAYYTHFALAALPGFRASTVQVVDVQPECQGKAEALRVLEQRFGIAAERVVAVGDANNDLHILRAAGLGVAMGNATPEAKAAAKRVIGDNNGEALGELIEELFLGELIKEPP